MFENILALKRDSELDKSVEEVIDQTVDIALNAKKERGLRLAAAFDLLAATEYYHSVANRGWTYCTDDPQMLIYPYTNTCPRCIGNKRFRYTQANKPESGQIGMVTSELLCRMLQTVFRRNGRNIEVSRASEPIDAIIYDKGEEKLIIAEVKSAPMMTIPLATYCERLTETIDGELVYTGHSVVDNPLLKKSEIGLYFPKNDTLSEKFVPLDVDWSLDKPFYHAIRKLEDTDSGFFDRYFSYWKNAYNAYANKDRDNSLFWLTNGCGQPVPRPNDWPKRRGTGYESVSDGKTSVGMDRTDDIKKAIYQVLKLGSEYKPKNPNVKTAIISNIHAVRHYDEYLLTVRDVIWALDHTRSVTSAAQLDPDTPIYNLFDGILSFTQADIRDPWIKEIYDFID